MFFIATPYHYPHVRRGYCPFTVFFGGWYVFDFMIFFAAYHFFDFWRFLALLPFVCVVFRVLAANKHFSFSPSPMSQVCSDVFSCVFNVSCETLLFSLWFIPFSPFVFYGIRGDILWFLLPCFSDSCVLTHAFMRLARRLSSVGVYRSSMSWHNFLAMPDRNNTNRVRRRRFPPEPRQSPC